MENNLIKAHVAVISHKRPHNIAKIQQLIGECTVYVNRGEKKTYEDAGVKYVVECGDNICEARNAAIRDASALNLPSIQVSDDLRSLKHVRLEDGKHVVEPTNFNSVCTIMISELERTGFRYGGVAVTTNRLNYTGEDFSYDKLVVCDLICVMPNTVQFDEHVALKEDYDLTIRELIAVGGLVRCNQFLCDFPHRDNEGGANTYRNNDSEGEATKKLMNKWGNCIKAHPTREGQISLNYPAIQLKKAGQTNLF